LLSSWSLVVPFDLSLALWYTLGCVRFWDVREWNGTIPFYCRGTIPSLCSAWTKNCYGTVSSLCSVLEWDENGMEWSENGIILNSIIYFLNWINYY
jgi:hypothetical protein